MFRLFIAFVTIIFIEIVGISFLKAAAIPLPKPPESPLRPLRHMSIRVPPSSPVRRAEEVKVKLPRPSFLLSWLHIDDQMFHLYRSHFLSLIFNYQAISKVRSCR